MKKLALICFLVGIAIASRGQHHSIGLSGGYSFSRLEFTNIDLSGIRINGTYAFKKHESSSLSHGFTIGYIGLKGNQGSVSGGTDYNINSVPIYYHPKVSFGPGNLKGFFKGALGVHFSNLKRSGSLGKLTSSDFGFYGGMGLGSSYDISSRVFISVEYEFSFLSNSALWEGVMHSALAGIGIKF